MDLSLVQIAIDAAIAGDWIVAEKVNNQILDIEPNNREALNRLGRAYAELGKIQKALSCYRKVLKIDPFNSIALKTVERLEKIETTDLIHKNENGFSHATPASLANIFLEEQGKTKTVSLLHLGDKAVINVLNAGEEVKLLTQHHKACINNIDNKYVGRFPDDIAARLIKLSRAGNKYKVYTKSVKSDEVKVFIREIERAAELEGIHSFPTEKNNYVSFTPPELMHEEKPDTQVYEEDY